MQENINIIKATAKDVIPWDLLLLADPEKAKVEDYLAKGVLYLALFDDEIVGEYILTPKENNSIELKNVAVKEIYQGKGIGKKLVLHAISKAKEEGYKTIEVGTGNTGFSQLALYQKCGFRMQRVIRDFFKDYEGGKPIMENGIRCIDMVVLSQDL